MLPGRLEDRRHSRERDQPRRAAPFARHETDSPQGPSLFAAARMTKALPARTAFWNCLAPERQRGFNYQPLNYCLNRPAVSEPTADLIAPVIYPRMRANRTTGRRVVILRAAAEALTNPVAPLVYPR